MTFSFTFHWKIHFPFSWSALLPHSNEFPPSASAFLRQTLPETAQSNIVLHTFSGRFLTESWNSLYPALAQWLRTWDWILYILNKSVCPFIPSHNGKESCKKGSNALLLCSISHSKLKMHKNTLQRMNEHKWKEWALTAFCNTAFSEYWKLANDLLIHIKILEL